MITGIISIGSLIWSNPLLRYGAMVLIALIAFRGWVWTHDSKVIADISRKAETHASAAIQAGNAADDVNDPVERLRKQYCRNC